MLRYFILIFVLCFYTLPIWSGSATSVFGSAQTQSDQDSTKTPASSVFGTSNIKSTSSTETSPESSSPESSESSRSSSVFSRKTSSSSS